MSKILTRRGQEYFEVLDHLCSKGYIPNEQWHLLSVKEQENVSRMTNRVIEDALLEHGYSKGSPTEQKRYRQLWMKERGINDGLSAESGVDQLKNLEADPIFSAVATLRKQLHNEANLIVEEAKKQAEQKVVAISNKNSELEAKIAKIQDKYNELATVHNELKNKTSKLENDLLEAVKEKINFESTLKAEQAGFFKDKKQFESDINNLRDRYNDLDSNKSKEIESLHAKYKDEISLIKEYSEKQRHNYIAEIENLKVSKNKLEKELDKAKDSEQKISRVNIELGQNLKSLEGNNKNLQTENNTLSVNLRNTEGALLEARGELKQLHISLTDQKIEYQNVSKQLLDYKEKVGRLDEQLQQAKIELLRGKDNNQNKIKNRGG